jgi:hypothetical protein
VTAAAPHSPAAFCYKALWSEILRDELS